MYSTLRCGIAALIPLPSEGISASSSLVSEEDLKEEIKICHYFDIREVHMLLVTVVMIIRIIMRG